MDNKEIKNKIHDYIIGSLTEEESEQLWREFFKDPELYQSYKTQLALRVIANEESQKSLETESSDSKVKELHPKNNRWWYMVAAAAIVIVAALFAIQAPNPNDIDQMIVQHIDTTQELEGWNNLRSGGKTIDLDSLNSVLSKATRYALANDLDKAVELYTLIIDFEQADSTIIAKASFNKGLLHYNNKMYEDAAVDFEKSLLFTNDTQVDFREKCLWYLSNTMVAQRKLKKAEQYLTEAYHLQASRKKEILHLYQKLKYNFFPGEDDEVPEYLEEQ